MGHSQTAIASRGRVSTVTGTFTLTSVPCCTFGMLWTGAAVLDVGLDTVFEPLARTFLLSMAFRELALEKPSRGPGFIYAVDMPDPLEFGFHDHYLSASGASSLKDCEVRHLVLPVDMEYALEAAHMKRF